MIGVTGATAGYAAALAELPLRARATSTASGAVVVVDGASGWPGRAVEAVRRGAVAVLVGNPVSTDPAEIGDLEAVAEGAPVVLDRPWLRADLVADAAVAVPARQLTVDAAGAAPAMGELTRDAVGWLRVLGGGDLVLRTAAALPHGLIALLEEPASGTTAALTVSALVGRGRPRLRALAVGQTRIEVDLDAATDVRSVESSSADGVLRLPRRHESGERLALRRAIDAALKGTLPADVREFRHDVLLAEGMRGTDKRG
ncbi:hypothetical protein [Microbacterium phyllosphaerae]|uniref:hypothetical protein n=1 Tax=Microbacterium phyllosphaerae TaxID=124798 RepID=UPI000EA0716E|nr:hypothetical protein [Microbacterium phyllosphaerae]